MRLARLALVAVYGLLSAGGVALAQSVGAPLPAGRDSGVGDQAPETSPNRPRSKPLPPQDRRTRRPTDDAVAGEPEVGGGAGARSATVEQGYACTFDEDCRPSPRAGSVAYCEGAPVGECRMRPLISGPRERKTEDFR